MPEPRHVELVIELAPGADAEAVAERLRGLGFSVMPIAAGLLASGTAGIPADLGPDVASVAVVPEKRWL